MRLADGHLCRGPRAVVTEEPTLFDQTCGFVFDKRATMPLIFLSQATQQDPKDQMACNEEQAIHVGATRSAGIRA